MSAEIILKRSFKNKMCNILVFMCYPLKLRSPPCFNFSLNLSGHANIIQHGLNSHYSSMECPIDVRNTSTCRGHVNCFNNGKLWFALCQVLFLFSHSLSHLYRLTSQQHIEILQSAYLRRPVPDPLII